MDESKWKEADDILGNQSILKQTIRAGEHGSRPSRNNLATISYRLFLVDSTTKESRLIDEVSNEEFFVGEFDILPAIDLSVQLMERGEVASIDSDIRHCYGEKGWPEKNLPSVIDGEPSYRMKIDVELHQWRTAEEIRSLTTDRRLFWADRKREKGNFALRRQDYPTALQCYRSAVHFVDVEENPALVEEETKTKLLVDRYVQVENNLAQVYLLTNQYDQCLETLCNVFKYEPKNIKGLFRQAKALFQLGNYQEALEPLKRLLEIDDDEVDKPRVTEMFRTCQNKVQKYHQAEKEIYQRMFKTKSTPIVREEVKTSPRKAWLVASVFILLLSMAVALAFKWS